MQLTTVTKKKINLMLSIFKQIYRTKLRRIYALTLAKIKYVVNRKSTLTYSAYMFNMTF